MILINLLPDEYKKQRRTPVKLLLAVSSGVAVNASLLAWWCWLAFGVRNAAELERDVLTETMAGVDPQVAHYQSLERENRQFTSREETLGSITQSRVNWTRKIDELIDVINKGGGGKKYLVWLDNLDISTTVDTRNETYGKLVAKAHSGSRDFAQLANFLDDVEMAEFSRGFYPPAPPEGQQREPDKTLSPSEFWDFTLQVHLMAPEQRLLATAGVDQ